MIETLSCLDFARVPLSAHGPLAAAAISMVSSDPAMLAELLSHIVDASAALVPQGTPADPVRASRALQLMRAAAAAMGPSSCPCWTPRRVADAVIPVAGAHLRHGAEPLRAAAHALFCRLLQRSSGDSRVSEAVASFYIGRTVAAFPWLATPEQLAASAGSVITALPANSLLQAMLPAHLIARAAELSSRAREGGAPAAGAGGTIKADGRPVEQLAQLSSECMLNASAQVPLLFPLCTRIVTSLGSPPVCKCLFVMAQFLQALQHTYLGHS